MQKIRHFKVDFWQILCTLPNGEGLWRSSPDLTRLAFRRLAQDLRYLHLSYLEIKLTFECTASLSVQELHRLPIRYRVQYKLCTLMYTMHHGLSPAYLSEQVNTVAAQTLRRGLLSASTTNYTITSTTYKVRRTSFFIRLTDNTEFSATRTQSCAYSEQFQAQAENIFLTLLLIVSLASVFYWQFNAPLFLFYL